MHYKDKLKNSRYTVFSFTISSIPTKVGNASITVEWNDGIEMKKINRTIPIKMGEADMLLYKRLVPFPVYHPPQLSLPNPNTYIDSELLGQVMPIYDDEYLRDTYPFPKSVGDMLVWYIRVQNNGPNIAFDVNVTDVMPEGVEFISFNASTGSNSNFQYDYNFGKDITYDSETGVFHIPRLYRTQYADITIFAKATTTGMKTNVAKVNSSTPDPDTTNNEENSSYRVIDSYDVSINKSSWQDNETMMKNANPNGKHANYTVPKIKLGENVFWLINVFNQGRYSAENFTLKKCCRKALKL